MESLQSTLALLAMSVAMAYLAWWLLTDTVSMDGRDIDGHGPRRRLKRQLRRAGRPMTFAKRKHWGRP